MKTAKFILAIVISIMTIQTYSQNSNELRIYYGISDSELLRNSDLDGVGNYDVNNFNEFGIKYLRQVKNNFSIEFGLNLLKSDIEHRVMMWPEGYRTRSEKLEIISIPIYGNYSFWKYLFVNAGPILDFQTTENSIDSQSGIGYSLGLGAKYNFNNISIFLNPNFKRHAVIPFEKENYHQKLTEFGIQFGLGYRF
ncbi:porin family protein [Gelidibacter salicanalis]|uniref:Porin family protein n=1 Tax=Gelidibacter salicanalis TaxID=291193 RepID=A0A5C7ADR9_9FLAO|nr:outer membrane beta-barrel protein [Gelidibacter salicanalis]TXE06611.1 porin family protein [Gelidibacter salicanalis]